MQETEQMLQFLRRRLKAQGITQKDLALKLNVSEASVKRMFAGENLSLARLEQVCQLIGLDLTDCSDGHRGVRRRRNTDGTTSAVSTI